MDEIIGAQCNSESTATFDTLSMDFYSTRDEIRLLHLWPVNYFGPCLFRYNILSIQAVHSDWSSKSRNSWLGEGLMPTIVLASIPLDQCPPLALLSSDQKSEYVLLKYNCTTYSHRRFLCTAHISTVPSHLVPMPSSDKHLQVGRLSLELVDVDCEGRRRRLEDERKRRVGRSVMLISASNLQLQNTISLLPIALHRRFLHCDGTFWRN